MIIQAVRTPVYKEKQNLTKFIKQNIKRLPDKSILVITSKIVALAEGRTRPLKDDAYREQL